MARLLPYLFVFAGLVLAALGLPGVYDTLKIANDVEEFTAVEARVLSHNEKKHQQGPPTVEVKFEFEMPDGRRIKGDNRYTRLSDDPDEVERAVVRKGGIERITVWYDPEDPRRAVISRDVSLMEPIGIIAIIVIAVGGGLQAVAVDKKRRALQARADEEKRRKEEERAARSV